MNNICLLDCTLRDGGRIIDCQFGEDEISGIIRNMEGSNIDIIEVGFIRDGRKKEYVAGSTFFTDVRQIQKYLGPRNNTIYTAFIDYGMCDIDNLGEYDGKSVDGIRFGFTKENYETKRDDIIRWANIIKNKGYKLFIQGVNTLNYSDYELLDLVQLVNELKPYSFGIVDTYGAMYISDIDRLYSLVDNNLMSDICINFHSHNNYQMSFALAQEVIKLHMDNPSRKIIIDGTLYGMGKVAGNLNIELIADFLNRKMHADYEMDVLLDCIDDYIFEYRMKYDWGYSISSLMAGIYKSHPNNVMYLTEKFRLSSKDIGKILHMLTPAERQKYDYDKVKELYSLYCGENIDDRDSVRKLSMLFSQRNILVLVPGSSINSSSDTINELIDRENPVVISVNFYADYKDAYAFFGNKKKYINALSDDKRTIVTSNIEAKESGAIAVNYQTLINRNHKLFDNSTCMLLNLLKKTGFRKLYFVGFDGFSDEKEDNFMSKSFQNYRHKDLDFHEINTDIASMIDEFANAVPEKTITFVTPTYYKDNVRAKNIRFTTEF